MAGPIRKNNRRIPHRVTSKAVFKNDFPLSVTRIRNHQASSMHDHDFQELVVIVSGKGMHHTEGEKYPIGSGDVFVIAPERPHRYSDTEKLYLINILFDAGRLGLPLQDLRNLPGYHALFKVEPQLRKQHRFRSRLRLSMDQLGRLLDLVSHIEDEQVAEEGGQRFMATAHLMQVIGYLSRSYTRTREPELRSVMRISEVLSHLERNYERPVTLEKLAKLAHMSQTSLRRTFSDAMGHSPIDYLIRLRIAKAKELLKGTDHRITDVAVDVGFEDSNYFSRQFRNIVGTSPRAFRARFKGAGDG